MATVIGPTPPGTGVIAEATSKHSGSTSPTKRCPDFFVLSFKVEQTPMNLEEKCISVQAVPGIGFIPQSITTTPSLSQLFFTKPGRPTAATRMSACLQISSIF